MSEKPGLEKPVTNLQALIWSVMMEAKYGKKDWLELLDETIDTLHDAYILYDYADQTVDTHAKRTEGEQ